MKNREKIKLGKKEKDINTKKIKASRIIKLLLPLFILILLTISTISLISAYQKSAVQYTQYKGPSAGFFSGEYKPDREYCEAGQDFMIQIAPFGCTPAVVRTDLLEEQNVPVFCQLAATKLNPLIKVEAIDSISFHGKYPKEIQGVGFHPASSALGIKEKLNSPVLENIGYAVIVLKKQPNTKDIPDYVQGEMTAKIRYDIKNAFGIGTTTFYLPVFDKDSDWEDKKSQYSFWNGKGYLRAEDIGVDSAKIAVYDDLHRITSVRLKKGEKSEDIYLPRMSDCLATIDLRLESLDYPGIRARLNINGEVVEVVDEERFLDNECRITNINKKGLVQNVDIKCEADDIETGKTKTERFTLKTNPGVELEINNQKNNYKVADKLSIETDKKDKNYYLGFIGTTKNSNNKEDLYALIVEMPSDKSFDDKTLSEIALYDKRCTDKKAGFLEFFIKVGCKFNDWIIKDLIKGENIHLVDITEKSIGTSKVSVTGFSEPLNTKLSGDIEKNYNLAMADFENVIDNYASEKDPLDESSVLAEEAFLEAIYLNYETGQKAKTKELCEKFKEKYPESRYIGDLCNEVKLANTETQGYSVMINGKTRAISLEAIIEPDYNEYDVVIDVRKDTAILQQIILTKEEVWHITDGTNIFGTIRLEEIKDDSARVKIIINSEEEGKKSTEKTTTLKKGSSDSLENYIFSVSQINLKKMAKVSVIPNIRNQETEANFTFKIGIEKRMIKLSPEQTKEKIENLDKSIKDWESKTEKLGNVVKGMKGACLATSTVLIAKNFLANTGGKGIARQNVMGEWRDKCQKLITDKKYSDYDGCFADNAEQIEKDVGKKFDYIQKQNDLINQLEKDAGITKDVFGTENVNTAKFMDLYYSEVQKYLEQGKEIICKDGSKERIIKLDSENNVHKAFGVKDGVSSVSIENARDIHLGFMELSGGDDSAMNRLCPTLIQIENNAQEDIKRQDELKKMEGNPNLKNVGYSILEDKQTLKTEYEGGEVINDKFEDIEVSSKIQKVAYKGKTYIVVVKNTQGNQYVVEKVYDENGYIIQGYDRNAEDIQKNLVLTKYDSSSYQNQFKGVAGETAPEPVIKLYDTEPYKGYPALVPFDRTNGWYAAIRQTLPVLGNIKSYESSGRVYSFYLCNVGNDGVAEFFSGINEDICHMVNPGMKTTTFSGLSETKTEELAGCAINAIEQVSRASVQGKAKTGEKITINTGSKCGGSWTLRIGKPAVEIPEMQCQDFMSVKDCQIMYNVCDPVICPSSRCDLGGAYPVTNVIQQGIIGGVALCLPNFSPDPMKGVVVPVCLSGIHAGLQGWVSILKNHRDCLQESLNTGKMIGVCDEIYSIYKCEFFWRQGLPVAKMAIPKLLERMYGQATRGGGEYLGIQSAWDNAGKSVDYFTQYYGANSFEAFKSRTIEEIGEEYCRLSVSASYPDGGNLLDALTEPDSPAQFHGRFEETPFSDITVPPISYYKVFYHIYAGKSSRAYYQVYLKGSPESTYYKDTKEKLVVANGYIQTGGYASETKDFTATSGYKEMCIVVNGQEECGFKQVSTSFAINYVKDRYMEEQASQRDIKTETECIAGSRSAYVLINPSMQGAADELTSPSIYNRGIVRVCATDNPGKGTDAHANANGSRWVDVGYCGNTNLRCWLDTDSVSDVIKNLDIEAETLEKINKQNLDVLKKSGNYLSDDEVENKIKEIEELQNQNKYQEAITKATETLEKTLWNNQKAKLYFERGKAYSGLAKGEKEKGDEEKAKQAGETATKTPSEILSDDKKCQEICAKESTSSGYDYNQFKIVDDFESCRSLSLPSMFFYFNSEEECCCYSKESEKEIDCGTCSEGLFGVCSMEECLAIGDEICEYEDKTILIPGGTCEEKISMSISGTYKNRYEEYKALFEKYSKQNLPSGWNEVDFRALLVAIAQKETSLGYPNGRIKNDDWLMGYDSLREYGDTYKGKEKQVSASSSTLKKAFNREHTIYNICNGKSEELQIECVLSFYNQGKLDNNGKNYARIVMEYWNNWKEYFSFQ